MLKSDYHVHTKFSFDSSAEPEEIIKTGIEKGITEICFTDHLERCGTFDTSPDYSVWTPMFESLKEKYKDKVTLKMGVEIGLDIEEKEYIESSIAKYDYDFIIGSSHSIYGEDLYYNRKFYQQPKKECYFQYFQNVLTNATAFNNISVYGHLDYVGRYANYDDNSLNYFDYKDIIDTILKKLIENGRGIEINTSGYLYNQDTFYPSIDILRSYKNLGGEIITIGSDSHKVPNIAHEFKKVEDALKSLDYKYICKFEKMKPIFVELD